jgi:hypothetical protein
MPGNINLKYSKVKNVMQINEHTVPSFGFSMLEMDFHK